MVVARSQLCWAFLCCEQLVMGDLPAAQSSWALTQGCDSSGSPRRQGEQQRCLERAWAGASPAFRDVMLLHTYIPVCIPLLPAIRAWFPSLCHGEDAGALVPAQAALGRSWFAPAAG